MVSQQELREKGRGIGAIVRTRQTARREGQRQEQIAKIQKQAKQQAKEELKILEEKRLSSGFQFEIINKATKNRPKTSEVVREFTVRKFGSLQAARVAAEKFAKEFGKDPAFRSDPKGIRAIPKGPVPRDLSGREILAPADPKADIGKRLQRRRERAEKIVEKATSGKELSIGERKFIQGGSGREKTILERSVTQFKEETRKVPVSVRTTRQATVPRAVQEEIRKRALITSSLESALGIKVQRARGPPVGPQKVGIGPKFVITTSVTGPKVQEISFRTSLSGKPLKSKEDLSRVDGRSGTSFGELDRRTISARTDISNLVSKGLSPKEEKIITGAERQKQRELQSIERSRKTSEIFRIIPGLRGDSFTQKFGRELLALPTRFTFGFGEQLAAAGEKTILTSRALLVPSLRASTKKELKRAAKATPSQLISSLDITTPSGLATVLGTIGAIALPKGISTTKATKGKIITAKIKERLPSTKIRVRELRGVEIIAKGLKTGFKEEAVIESRPIFGKSELLEPSKIKIPEFVIAEVKGAKTTITRTERVAALGKEAIPVKQPKIKVEETIERIDVLTLEQARKVQIPKLEKAGFAREFSPLRQEVKGKASIFFEALDVKTRAVRRRPLKPTSTGRGRSGKIELKEPSKEITFIPKLERDIFVQTLEKRPGKVIIREVRKTPRGEIIKRTIEQETPEVFIKDPFGFGKKRFTKQAQQIKKALSKEPSVESGGLVQLLKPAISKVKPKLKQRTEQISIQKARQKTRGKTLQELLGRQKAKERTGIFVIEDVAPRQRAATATLLLPKLVPISAQGALASQQIAAQQQAASQIGVVSTAELQGQQVSVSQSVLSAQAKSLAASQLASQSILQTQQQAAQQAALQQKALAAEQVSTSILDTVPESKLKKTLRKKPRFPKGLDQEGLETTPDLITEKAPSFDVQIRKGEKRGDKFITVNKNLPENKALRLFKRIVDSHIEASGRLRPSKKKAKVPDDLFAPSLIKFRRPRKGSKLPSNTIIEKKQHRLDTQGEVDQISFFKRQKELRKRIARLRGNPGLVERLNPDIPFRTELNLKLPSTTKIQTKILEIVKKEGAAVTGSFAEKTFVKGSRGFTDIDIVTPRVKILARRIKKALGRQVRIKEVQINSPTVGKFKISRVFSTKTGKQIADIDPLKFAEEGRIKEFGTRKVQGLNIVNVRARLQAKIAQLKRGKTKRGKVAKDIMQLTVSKLKSTKSFLSKSTKQKGFFSKGGLL